MFARHDTIKQAMDGIGVQWNLLGFSLRCNN